MVQSQTQQNYIGINGIVTQDLNSIIAELKNDFKGIYGKNINLESNTSDGQWLNILAQQKIDALDFQVQLYNNLDVDSVVGLPQQVLYKLNGLTIKDFTYSFVYVNVTVSQNVSLSGLDGDIANTDGTGYTVTDINGNNWILAESISLVQNDEPYLLLFRAQELGQITALANTITTMSTIVAGVTEVNNPANNFITGQTGETAAEFRTRRNRSLQAPSQGFKESIEGQLLALNDVSDAKVYDNKDDANIDGVQVIVQGGTSNEIGNIIYNNLPPGINTQGAYEATITVNNRNKVLNYDKPNPIPILVKGTIESLTGYPNDVDLDYVKQTLASKQFNIGEIAESANITTQLKNILGETGSPYDIELSLGATGGEWSDVISIGGNTYSDIIFDGLNYVAVGANGKIAHSTDLETFNVITTSPAINWKKIIYADNTYITVGTNNTGVSYISTSTILPNWSSPAIINNDADLLDVMDICYGDGKYIIVARNDIYISNDLATWELVTSPSGWWNSIAFDGTYFNIMGTGGYNKWCKIDTDGTLYDSGTFNFDATRVFYKNNLYFYLGTGTITIFDGLSYNTKQVGSNVWRSIDYYDGMYIVVGQNGYTALTTDLDNWTIVQVDSNNWNSIINDGTKFVSVGTGVTTYTLPSIDWQEILTPTGLADFYVMTVSGMDDLEVIA